MTLVITREIFSALQGLLRVSGKADSQPELLTAVLPVINLPDVMSKPRGASASKDLSIGAGTYVVYGTVGKGKRWTIANVWIVGTVGTPRLAASIGGTTIRIGISSSTERQVILNITLNEGDSLGMGASGNGSDTAVAVDWTYTELDVGEPSA